MTAHKHVLSSLITCLLMLCAFGAQAYDEVLYATDRQNNLYSVDPASRDRMTLVGNMGTRLGGLAVDPTTGILYGSTPGGGNSGTGSTLHTISRVTGLATLVGALASGPFIDLEFDSTGQLYGFSKSGYDLYRIDKTTAVTTLVGDSGLERFTIACSRRM